MAFFSCWTKFWLSWVALFPSSVPIPCRAGVSSRTWTLRCASWGGMGAARSATPGHDVQQAGIGNDQLSYLWRRCRGPDRGAWHGWHGGHRGETTGWCSPSNSRRRGATTTTFNLEGAEDTVQTIRFAIVWNRDDGPIKFSQFPPVPGWDPPPPWPLPAWPRCSRAPGRGGQGSKESWELARQECKAYKLTI